MDLGWFGAAWRVPGVSGAVGWGYHMGLFGFQRRVKLLQILTCSVAPILFPLFLGGCPSKNSVFPKKGALFFSRVTEQLRLLRPWKTPPIDFGLGPRAFRLGTQVKFRRDGVAEIWRT